MAAPNILSMSTITAASAVLALTTSAVTIGTTVPANQAYRVTSLYASNITSSSQTVTITMYKNPTTVNIVYQASIPGNCTLAVIDKTSPINLQEGDYIQCLAGAASAVNVIMSYEFLAT